MVSLQGTTAGGSPHSLFGSMEDAWAGWLFGDVVHTNANLLYLSGLLDALVVTRRPGEAYGERRDEAGNLPAVYMAITSWEPDDDTSNSIRWKLTMTVHVWATQSGTTTGFATVRAIASSMCSMINQMHRAGGIGDLDTYIGESPEPEFSPVLVRVDPQEDNAIVYESTFTFSWWYRETLGA